MCEGQEGFTRNGITYVCCYNHYFNGSTCVDCLAGFYGNDCSRICDKGLYGERCSKKCKCDNELCHHITGCLSGFSGSSEIPQRRYKISSVNHVKAFSNSPVLPLTSTTPTADIQIPQQTNMYILAIGSVIALFLGIIAVQFCIKLGIKRKKYTQQMSVHRKPVKEEETYHEINESLMDTEGNDSRNEQGHVGKYDELQTSNQATGVPYDKIKTQAHYQDISDSLIDSSCNSDSSNSNKSYLKPKTSEKFNYVNVTESSTAKGGMISQNSPVNSTNDRSNVSSQYLDPIQNLHNVEIVLQSNEIGVNNDAYLDVTHDTFV
uniref:MEGF10_11 n=1 Tax=Magallana gigas TaxID=29159 RepID=A0A8W8L7J0_MAGGI|nr:multiple epidermal growth factor-like domains protein 10 [Crassostrea gigas]